jgi:hypothetical protein
LRRVENVQRWYAEYAANDEASTANAGKDEFGTGRIREQNCDC